MVARYDIKVAHVSIFSWMSIYQPFFRSLESSSVVGFAGSVVLSEDVVGNSEIKYYNIYLPKHN